MKVVTGQRSLLSAPLITPIPYDSCLIVGSEPVTWEYSIQVLLQKQSPDSLAHSYKASTNNVLGSSGDLPKAVTAQNSSLKQWPHFADGLIIFQTALKFTGYAPSFYSATCILKMHC